ncbi:MULTISPECIES: MFS transporter [Sphingomonas]|uniref:MFS transporter n=1 Tax=Sphingomonas TaxID=13687 RepID=UPI000DEFA887|nr:MULTISPECIES: MFS transporter [Sphingomonas]
MPEPLLSPHRPVPSGSLAIAAFSTIVEWYDFTLYLYFATVLSRVMFGGGEAGLLTTLASFALAYLLRPLGALFFGHIGDRHGRRRSLLLSVALMTAAMLAMALLPTHAEVGGLAGVLMMLLRCVMGFAVGGEYTGVVAYLLEGAPAHRRGLITSLAAAASEVGGLLAVFLSALIVSLVPPGALEQWGWRIPFLFGALLAAGVWALRTTVAESPEYERQQAAGTVPSEPLRHALTHHRAGILRGFAISALGSITYYVGISYVPAFLTSVGSRSETTSLWWSTGAAVAVILVTPLVGLAADRWGRKPPLLLLCLGSALLPATMFWLMAGGSPALALGGTLVLACLAGGVSAVGAVATAEQFAGEARLTGLALGATVATAIFGGLTPYVAQRLSSGTGWPSAPGLMIAVVALAVLPVLWRLPETKPALGPEPRSPDN